MNKFGDWPWPSLSWGPLRVMVSVVVSEGGISTDTPVSWRISAMLERRGPITYLCWDLRTSTETVWHLRSCREQGGGGDWCCLYLPCYIIQGSGRAYNIQSPYVNLSNISLNLSMLTAVTTSSFNPFQISIVLCWKLYFLMWVLCVLVSHSYLLVAKSSLILLTISSKAHKWWNKYTYHFLVSLANDLLAFHHSILLSGNGDLVLHDAERRNIDADSVLCHHVLDPFVVGATDEWMEVLGNLQFLIRLLALFRYREEC